MTTTLPEPTAAPPDPTDPAAIAADPVVAGRRRHRVGLILTDVAHRSGAVALFATVAVWACVGTGKGITWPLAIAAGAADLGLVAAGIARLLAPDAAGRRRLTGVLVFNGVVFAASLYLMLFDRIDPLRNLPPVWSAGRP